ncbi:MAG: TIR domain-containing protein [Anaerolineae bacterium]|nr:TIR domain-containing protein [Anaerolineae bacterium]
MSRIFLNYRRQDSEGYVGRLYDHLAQHFAPDDIFMDVQNIAPGQDFVQVLEEAVAACDALLAVIGPAWLAMADEQGRRRLDRWDDFVRIEIASALKHDKLVIPVLVGRAPMPAPADLPDDLAALARRNAIELSHRDFAADVERLVRTLKAAISTTHALKPPADEATRRAKTHAIKAVRDDLISATDSPLYAHRIENGLYPVLGDGNPDAALLFIGESPGIYEARQGRPFVGPSGDILDELLGGIGLRREDVYVTNIVLDKPPDKRDPTTQEIAYYAPFVDRLIDIIQPAVIVTLGRFAMSHILRKLDLPEQRGAISKLHGRLIEAQMPYGPVHVVPMYHPAVVLYTASQKDVLREDFEKLRIFV